MTRISGKRFAVAVAIAMAVTLAIAAPASAVDSGGYANSPTLEDARALVKAKRWGDAIGALRYVLDEQPNNADANNLMGYSLRKFGNTDRALGFYLKALKISPNHKGANEYLGELYVETGQIAKAKERLEVLKAICGTSCEEYLDLKEVIDGAI